MHTGRELLSGKPVNTRCSSSLVIAAPNFNYCMDQIKSLPNSHDPVPSALFEKLQELKGAEEEGNKVAEILGVEVQLIFAERERKTERRAEQGYVRIPFYKYVFE